MPAGLPGRPRLLGQELALALARLATFTAAPRKSVAEITYTSEVSWKRMIACVSITGSMLRKAWGSTTCPIDCR